MNLKATEWKLNFETETDALVRYRAGRERKCRKKFFEDKDVNGKKMEVK
jgi:hypothetical protein